MQQASSSSNCGGDPDGYSLSLFSKEGLDQAEENELICSICLNIIKDAVQCTGGHSNCRQCILKYNKPSCPSCRCKINLKTLIVSRAANNFVQNLPVLCKTVVATADDNDDVSDPAAKRRKTTARAMCEWRGCFKHLNSHMTSCVYVAAPCKFDGCGEQLPRMSLAEHEMSCEHRAVACWNQCGVEMSNTAEGRESHKPECSLEIISCPFFSQLGCYHTCPRRDMAAHAADAVLHVEVACRNMAKLRGTFTKKSDLSQIKRLDAEDFLNMLEACMGDEVIVASCLSQLKALSTFNLAEIGTRSGCEAVVAAMHRHPTSASVAQYGCFAVSSLARTNDCAVKLGSAGGCETVLAAMKGHPANTKVIRDGCTAICSLSMGNADNRARLGRLGACEVVMTAAKSDATAYIAMMQCMRAISLLAADHYNGIKLVALGGCEEIVATMNRHLGSVSVSHFGCAALLRLAKNSDNLARLSSAGACTALAAARRSHSTDTRIESIFSRAAELFALSDEAL